MKKIILGLVLLGSVAFSETEFQSSRKQFEQKYEAGDSQACGYAGAFYQAPTLFGGNASDRDYKKILYFYKKACDGNIYKACSDLGWMYDNGKGVKKDYKKAVELYNKACDGGLAENCNYLGNMYAVGEGVKKDYKKAVELYNKACDGNFAGGCNNLGYMYGNGKGVKMDMTRAMGYYRRACDADSWIACGNFASGLEADGDRVRAVQYYQKACEMDKKESLSSDYDKDLLREYCDKYDILK